MDMKSALNQVWQAVANDILPSEDECQDFAGDQVAEIVGDCASIYLTGEELKAWTTANYPQQQQWLKEAFPDHELYGL